ncbi:MAG: hypothetical protein P8N72_18970 [Flavimaricola sp.]|nr:hypothetical protein [Flavimaricola sp.]
MINVKSKKGKTSEGEVRIDEMAELKKPKSSTSNKKIAVGLGGMFALIAYLRSFGSEQQAEARGANESPQQEPEEVYLTSEEPEVSDWQVEVAQEMPADNSTLPEESEGTVANRLFKAKSSAFPSQDMTAVSLPQVSLSSPDVLAPPKFPVDGVALPSATVAPEGPAALVDEKAPVVAKNGPSANPEVLAPTKPTEQEPATPETSKTDPSGSDASDQPDATADETVTAPETTAPATPDELSPTTPEPVVPEPSAPEAPGEPVNPADPVGPGLPEENPVTAPETTAPTTPTDPQPTAPEPAVRPLDRVYVEGSASSDTITGTDAAEEILGLAGADLIDGMGGDDVLFGGAGNDVIDGGDGNDALMGGVDDDRLTGGAGDDLVMGEAGDDVVDGGVGNDLLLGGIGTDTLFGREGDDRLVGGEGADVLHDGSGRDVLLGGIGNDTIHLFADADADFIDGGDGFDSLDLTAAQVSSRTDIALGEVQLDGGPANQIVDVEAFVSGSAADEFDFSGLVAAKPDGAAPMFFQITDFSRGDTVRVSESFAIGFDDFADDRLWASMPEAGSELETRMREASGETADAVPSRLSFRSASEEGIVARVIDFDLDGDGHVDLALLIQGNLPEDPTQFSDQV